MNDHSINVKAIFEKKALDYDNFMVKCVPDYFEMLGCMINVLPYSKNDKLKICDLGSGTGNVTKLLLDAYPNAEITCVDISQAMTDMAKAKFEGQNIKFEISDFYDYEFNDEYDLIISSWALHHIVTDEDKKDFYRKIYAALKPGGAFYNADVIISATDHIEERSMGKWKSWLRQYHSEEDMMEMIINRYFEEDRPTTIINHINWMQELGFKEIDIIWKRIKSVVYGGFK